MCNMAAYVGEQQAAPILLRMIANQEGYGGGHFTGIATIDNGKLYYAKVCGDLSELLKRTNAAELPGTVGIVHSRTPADPQDEWAHPYIAMDESVAYCANGIYGIFANPTLMDTIYTGLVAQGWSFRTEMEWPLEDKQKSHRLPNGHVVHGSDFMCGFIASKHKAGKSLEQSIREAYTEAPEELAGLCISPDEPGRVTAARINQPLVWGRREDGGYLATSALGFKDEKLSETAPVPLLSTAILTRDGLNLRGFGHRLCRWMAHQPYGQVTETLNAFMADGKEHHICDLVDAIEPLWKEAGFIGEAAMYAYEYVYEMQALGRIKTVRRTDKASLPDHECPRWYFQLA